MSKIPNFDVSKEEFFLILKIVDRADKRGFVHGARNARSAALMDISAVHTEHPLRLEAWLNADDGNFLHDYLGIARHINRETGELMNGFMPRFAMPARHTAA